MSFTPYFSIFLLYVMFNTITISSVFKIRFETLAGTFEAPRAMSIDILDASSPTSSWWIPIDFYENIHLFVWDRKVFAPSQYQKAYCSRMCHGNTLLFLNYSDKCLSAECFPCDCNKPLCEMYGTCCPDNSTLFSDTAPDSSNVSSLSQPVTQYSVGSDDKPLTNSSYGAVTDMKLVCSQVDQYASYLVVRSCPSFYTERSVKSRCEDDIDQADLNISSLLHVTDKETGQTYFNKYCATCNSVVQLLPWSLLVECENYMRVYKANSDEELFRLGREGSSGCRIYQEPPSGVFPHKCNNTWFGTTVDKCNKIDAFQTYDDSWENEVRNIWRNYSETIDNNDEDIQRACEEPESASNSLLNRVKFRKILFKNIFCVFCNSDTILIPLLDICQVGNTVPPHIRLPFSVLLDINPHKSQGQSLRYLNKCSKDVEWASPDNQCMPFQCYPGKILTNSSCSTALPQICGLGYKLRVSYLEVVSTEIHTCSHTERHETHNTTDLYSEYLVLLQNQMTTILPKVTTDFELTLTVVFPKEHENYSLSQWNKTHENKRLKEDLIMFHMNQFRIDGFLLTNRSFGRDEVETFLVSELIEKNITLVSKLNRSITLTPTLDISDTGKSQSDCTSVSDGFSCKSLLIIQQHDIGYFSLTFEEEKQNFLIIEPHLNCPFVSFKSNEYFHEKKNSTNHLGASVTLYFSNIHVTLTNIRELNLLSIAEDGTLRVCQQLLNIIANKYNLDKDNWINVSQYLLTVICVSFSILCLSLTLITYILFRVLRSIAGWNNMFLSGSLMLAQASLLTTSLISETGYLCTFMAVSAHFLWLSMFCWCFTCCFHMFRVFSATTRNMNISISSKKAYILKRVAICSIIPLVIVIGVIFINNVTSPGRHIGYGERACFLDSRVLSATTVVTPLCFTLLSNIFFLSYTIFKIYKVRRLQIHVLKKGDRRDLYIYIKLSTITGMFWILSVIAEVTNNDPIQYMAIFMNGFQGMFIFLSYTCNKRVLNLYMKALGFHKEIPTTSASDRSTVATIISDIRKHLGRSRLISDNSSEVNCTSGKQESLPDSQNQSNSLTFKRRGQGSTEAHQEKDK